MLYLKFLARIPNKNSFLSENKVNYIVTDNWENARKFEHETYDWVKALLSARETLSQGVSEFTDGIFGQIQTVDENTGHICGKYSAVQWAFSFEQDLLPTNTTHNPFKLTHMTKSSHSSIEGTMDRVWGNFLDFILITTMFNKIEARTKWMV